MDTNENNLADEMNVENNKKGKFKKIILITVISLVLITIVGIVLANSGIFKSKSEKFIELLITKQGVTEIIEDRANDFKQDGEINYNVALKKNFLSKIDSTFRLLGNDLVLDANVIKQEKNIDTKALLKLGTFELQSLELIKEENSVALSVPNLFENFIAISGENNEEVATKLGFIESGEKIKSNKEIETILKDYGKTIIKSLDKYVVVNNDVELKLNEETLTTKEYILTLREKDINEIESILLKKLKEDEKTIRIISDYTEISGDTLKEKVEEKYNELMEKAENITNETKIIELKINALKDENLKTTLSINEKIEASLYTKTTDTKDNIILNLNINGTIMSLEYIGTKQDKNYNATINLNAAGENITAIEINVELVIPSEKLPRKISEVNPLILNEALDSEIAKLRREIERNLGISSEEELGDPIYEEGEFKLNNPEAKVEVLKKSVENYNKLNVGMTRDEVINIMGEPSAAFEVNERENMGWYFDEKNSIYYISAELKDGKTTKIYNDIVSDMEDNVQVSVELGTQIEDLTTMVSSLKYGMTKSEVVNILGDKFLEISKDEEGFKTYKWYDKRENILVIEFDNEEKVSYVNTVTMDI